jgi:hypothetical protein
VGLTTILSGQVVPSAPVLTDGALVLGGRQTTTSLIMPGDGVMVLAYDITSHEVVDTVTISAVSDTNYPTTVAVAASDERAGPWTVLNSVEWPTPAITLIVPLPRTVSRYWQITYGPNPTGNLQFAPFTLSTNVPHGFNQTYLVGGIMVLQRGGLTAGTFSQI